MSEDLIERLRARGRVKYFQPGLPECIEAADEIERLRAKLAEADRRNQELNREMSGVRRSYREELIRAEAAEKRLVSAKEVIAPFSDRLQQLPWVLLQRGLSAPVSIAALRAAAEWMEKGYE